MSLSIKNMIVNVYSNLIEENIDSWLKSEEVEKNSKMSPKEKIELKIKIKKISKDIADEFAQEVINRGFPEKELSDNKIESIINSIIKKHIERLKKNERNKN